MMINILKTHQLDMDECYKRSTTPLRSFPFTTGVKLGVFCGVWDNAGFLCLFLDSWVFLCHIFPLKIFSRVRVGGDSIHSITHKTIALPSPLICPLWVFTILQIMQNPRSLLTLHPIKHFLIRPMGKEKWREVYL